MASIAPSARAVRPAPVVVLLLLLTACASSQPPEVPAVRPPVAFTTVGTNHRATILLKPAPDRDGQARVRREIRLEAAAEPALVLATWDGGEFPQNDVPTGDQFLGSNIAEPDWIYVAYRLAGNAIGLAVVHRDSASNVWTPRTATPLFESLRVGPDLVSKAFQVVFSQLDAKTGAAEADIYVLYHAGDMAVTRMKFQYNPNARPGTRAWKPEPRFDFLMYGDDTDNRQGDPATRPATSPATKGNTTGKGIQRGRK